MNLSEAAEVARPATEVRQQTKHGARTRATRSAFQRTSPSLERKDTVGRSMENTLNHFMTAMHSVQLSWGRSYRAIARGMSLQPILDGDP